MNKICKILVHAGNMQSSFVRVARWDVVSLLPFYKICETIFLLCENSGENHDKISENFVKHIKYCTVSGNKYVVTKNVTDFSEIIKFSR